MSYTIDEHNRERQRLLFAMVEPITRRFLSGLPIRAGGRGLDLACGIGQTTRLLAEYLGADGECVGLDQNAELVRAAESGPPGRARLEFRVGDATRLPFEDATFDLVFTRYLLIHVPEPRAVLAEMRRVVRPGAVIAVQEPENSYQRTVPESWAYPRMIEMFEALFAHACFGRELVSLFRELGLEPKGAAAELPVEFQGSTAKRLFRLTAEGMGPEILKRGLMSEGELDAWCAELRRVEEDPGVVCLGHPLVSVWAVG